MNPNGLSSFNRESIRPASLSELEEIVPSRLEGLPSDVLEMLEQGNLEQALKKLAEGEGGETPSRFQSLTVWFKSAMAMLFPHLMRKKKGNNTVAANVRNGVSAARKLLILVKIFRLAAVARPISVLAHFSVRIAKAAAPAVRAFLAILAKPALALYQKWQSAAVFCNRQAHRAATMVKAAAQRIAVVLETIAQPLRAKLKQLREKAQRKTEPVAAKLREISEKGELQLQKAAKNIEEGISRAVELAQSGVVRVEIAMQPAINAMAGFWGQTRRVAERGISHFKRNLSAMRHWMKKKGGIAAELFESVIVVPVRFALNAFRNWIFPILAALLAFIKYMGKIGLKTVFLIAVFAIQIGKSLFFFIRMAGRLLLSFLFKIIGVFREFWLERVFSRFRF